MKKLFFILIIVILSSVFPLLAGNGVQRVWVKHFNSNSSVAVMQLDSASNVYIGGYDYIIKYNSAGNQLWTASHQGNPTSLLLKKQNLVFVYMGGDWDNGYAYGIKNINPETGTQNWELDYTGDQSWNEPIASVQDKFGNLYVVGFSGQRGHYNCVLTKINPAGQVDWQKIYDSGFSEQPTDVVISQTGDIYIAGNIFKSNRANYLLLKYDSDGQFKWSKTYVGKNNNWAEAVKASLDSDGNLYVAGFSGNYDGHLKSNFHILKYDSDGNLIWLNSYDGPYNGHDWDIDTPTDLLVNSDGIFVTGGIASSSEYDWVVIKYDFDGNRKWVNTYNNGYSDYPVDLAADAQGNIYVVGKIHNPKSGFYANMDFLTVKYNGKTGQRIWQMVYDGSSKSYDRPTAIAVDGNYDVYVSGTTSYFKSVQFTTIKYSQTITGISQPLKTVKGFSLYQNYPNPFNPVTTINYQLPQANYVELTIYNVSGQKVATLVSGKQIAGKYQVRFNANNLPSGTYIYQLKAGNFIQTKKMILLK